MQCNVNFASKAVGMISFADILLKVESYTSPCELILKFWGFFLFFCFCHRMV